MRWYCTYCDRNYLVRLLALTGSLGRHEQQPFTIFVVCLDELTRILLRSLGLPNVSTIGLHELERGDPALREVRGTRSLVEYYWTLTPIVLRHLFEQRPEIDRLTYLDADLYFFGSPASMFLEAPDASVLIHGHRFARRYKELEAFGIYNVGLLSFVRNPEAFSILHLWREQCLAWCYATLEDGKFGDQMYLDDWPQRFGGVHVLQHPGVGIAPWNQNDISFGTGNGEEVMVDDAPLVFYHFHSLAILSPEVYVPSNLLHYRFDLPVLLYCYLPYVSALQREIARLQAVLPEFECGISHRAGTVAHTLLLTMQAAQILSGQLNGFSHTTLGNGWTVGRLPVELPDPAALKPA